MFSRRRRPDIAVVLGHRSYVGNKYRMFSRKRRAIIAAGHACMKKGSGEWWAFIRHQGRRGSKKIGSSKTKALAAADIINIRLALSQVGLDLCRPGKKAPPLLKLEHIRQLKGCLTKIGKRARASEIPLWALEIVEHQVLWEGVAAHRRGEESPVHTREEILEAAIDLTETYGTQRKYDQSLTARNKLDDLMYRAESDSHESASQPKPETNANPEKFPPETHENFSKPDPTLPSQHQTGSRESQTSRQAWPARSPKTGVIVKPKRERILYEQTRKRKEFKEALRKRYSPRMGYGPRR